MANEPDKFRLKFWMLVDADSKYACNSFPYLGKDETRDTCINVPTNVVMNLMQPLFKHSYNVTCDNFFTSLDVAVRLAKEKCSLVGIFCQNCTELPQAAKVEQELHETTIFKTTTASTNVTLTCYKYKKAKSVIILSTLHSDVGISSENNIKKKQRQLCFITKPKQEWMLLIRSKGNTLLKQQVEGGLYMFFTT